MNSNILYKCGNKKNNKMYNEDINKSLYYFTIQCAYFAQLTNETKQITFYIFST